MNVPERVLITGGAGFIGSHLADHLLARGADVVVLDDLSAGRLSNLAGALDHPRFEFINGSVLDPQLLARVVARVDAVAHLAAAVGVQRVMEASATALDVNVRGAWHVLGAAQTAGTKVLLASTSEVYGKSARLPFVETDDCVLGAPSRLRWSYAAGKLVGEFMAAAMRADGLPVTVARLFNTVGARQSHAYGMVLPRFVAAALRGEPLTVFGTGEQSRCFCHVDDAVRALADLLGHPDALGGTFNIGSTDEVSINDLARRVVLATGSRSKIVRIPYEEAFRGRAGFEDPSRRLPDISRARAVLGWTTEHSLDQAIGDVARERGFGQPARRSRTATVNLT